MTLIRLMLGLAAVAVFSGVANAGSVYVLKSQALGNGSMPPTRLFHYATGDTAVTDLGEIKVGGASIDADGLALSSAGLFAWQLTSTGSQLMEIELNPGGPGARLIGAELTGRDIRGAAFDRSGVLWTLDAASSELVTVDISTGNVMSVVATLTPSPGNVSDIAFRSDGTLFASSAILGLTTIYTVDITTGIQTAVYTDSARDDWRSPQIAGIAFDGGSPDLYAWDVENWDDIFSYSGAGYSTRTQLVANIYPAFNGGRGDMAAATAVPLPSAGVTGLALLIGLMAARRARGRL